VHFWFIFIFAKIFGDIIFVQFIINEDDSLTENLQQNSGNCK